MNWKPETWTAVLHALRRGFGVVPVIGPDLQQVPDPDSPGDLVAFTRLLARRLRETLSASERGALCAQPTLHQLALAPSFRARPQTYAEQLNRVQSEVLPAAEAAIFPASEPPDSERHPLRLLAEITAFPLYLTTTPDALVRMVLGRVRGMGDADVRGFQLVREPPKRGLGNDHRGELAWDLPPGWDASTARSPFLFHLFGRLDDPDGVARFDVTEEDHFEMLCRLQSEEWRPEQLCRELRPSHVLVLGEPLAEWHARFFLRLLRGDRLSEHSSATTEGIVDELFKPGPPPPHYENLATFLDNFSETSRIYRDGSPEVFVRELHHRWSALSKPSQVAVGISEPSPANLERDGVFISYCSEDSVAAERLAQSLRNVGVKAYLDKSRNHDASQLGLEHGSDFERKLRDNVQRAVFFIPLLSSNVVARGGWFRREWAWACEYDDEWFGFANRGYLRPVIVDGATMGTMSDAVPEKFQNAHVVTLEGGQPNEAFLTGIVSALKRWQGQAPIA